jgi:uncharacterized phage-associated protein
MLFQFNIDKTIQAIATLLHFHGTKEMSYLRILKLLYIADRESLKETGRPITGDHVVAMEHGPVLSGVFDLIKGEHRAWKVWSEYLKKNGYRIEMTNDPGNGRLSKYEIGKLRDLAERYADKNEWDMVEIAHTFEEWKRNNPGKSSKPIPLEHILEAVGRAGDKDAIEQDARDQAAFDRFFAGVAK